MAATHESYEAFDSASGSTTYNLTVDVPVAADFIVVSFSSYVSGGVSVPWASSVALDPTGNNDLFTNTVTEGGQTEPVEQWYLQNPTSSGSQTLRITLAQAPGESLGTVVDYWSGMLQSGDPIVDTGTDQYVAADDTVSVTTPVFAATDMAVMHGYSYSGVQASSGGTLNVAQSNGDNYMYSRYVVGTANEDFSITGATNTYLSMAVGAYSPAAVGGVRPKHSPLAGPFSGPFGGPM